MENYNFGENDEVSYARITDVTLREGDQAPLTSFNSTEKSMIGLMLSELGVDVIEVGFGVSREDFKNIKSVATNIGDRPTVISSLGRALEGDTIASLEALEGVVNPRIHIFLAMSAEHLKGKFGKKGESIEQLRNEKIEQAKAEIERSIDWKEKNNSNLEIEFSPEDATGNALLVSEINNKKYFKLKNNPDFDFLVKVCEEAIISGATIINVPDTLGNLGSIQTYEFFKELTSRLEYLKNDYDFRLSCHIHNDLGVALGNATEAIRGGNGNVDIESTLKGIGERTGNSPTEEVMGFLSEKGHDIVPGKDIQLNPKVKLGLVGPVSDFVAGILSLDKSLMAPYVGALSNIDGSGVHNANPDLYGGSKNKSKYGGAEMPEFFSPRGGANQIVGMLKQNGITLRKDSLLVSEVTKIAAKKSEESKALYVNNIYSIYLEVVKNFNIEKLEIHNKKLEIIIVFNGDRIILSGEEEGNNGIVKTFVGLINNFLGEEIIKINDMIVKRKANIKQEYEKFKKRVEGIVSEDFLIRADKVLKGVEDENTYSEAKAISQIVLDIDGKEITTIAGDNNVAIANIKAILEGVIPHLSKHIKKQKANMQIEYQPVNN